MAASKDFQASFGKLSSSFGFGGTTAACKPPKRTKNKNVNRTKVAQKDTSKIVSLLVERGFQFTESHLHGIWT